MTHFSVGEEATNVGAMLALNDDAFADINREVVVQASLSIDLNGMMAIT